MRKAVTRLLLAGAAMLGVLAVAGAAWLGWTARRAQAELVAARAELGPLRSEVVTGDAAVAERIKRLRTHAAAARDLTHDPVWTVAAGLPWLGSPAATVSGLTAAVDAVAAQGVPALSAAATAAHPAHLLRSGAVDVDALAASSGSLGAASRALSAQREAVAALPASWLSPVAAARSELLGQLDTLSGATASAHTASRIVPDLLGRSGPRRYFVAFQNPAEARGTGGLLDAYAIVRAERGKLVVERTGANTELPALPDQIPGLDQDFLDRYASQGATSLWVNANLSPDFPEVGGAWLAMWKASTGQQLDGAVALDPEALATVLRSTGPVTAPVVGTVTADQVSKLVLLEQYQRKDLAAHRKQLMLGVGIQTMQALLAGRATPQTLIPALDAAARAGHVKVYSRVAAEQQVFAGSDLGGAVPDGTGPFALAVVVNAAGNKLDSWLRQALRYQVQQCTDTGRQVAITVDLANSAPRAGLPEYVTVRSDRPRFRTVPGQNRVELQLLLTKGAVVQEAELDGKQLPLAPPSGDLPAQLPTGGLSAKGMDSGFLDQGVSAGRPAYGVDLELLPGGRRTLTVHVLEPAGTTGRPLLPVQPMVLRPSVSSDVTACGVGS